MLPQDLHHSRLAQALACLALAGLSACAGPVTPTRLSGTGLAPSRSLSTEPGSATAEPLMDYGVALFDVPAGVGGSSTAQLRPQALSGLVNR